MPAVESLPDILVDPFRDEASVRRKKSPGNSVELTGGLLQHMGGKSVASSNGAAAPRRMSRVQKDSSNAAAPAFDPAVTRSAFIEPIQTGAIPAQSAAIMPELSPSERDRPVPVNSLRMGSTSANASEDLPELPRVSRKSVPGK
jgi:hypothetical protein